jgi:tetratricopeptide (TPR) repeat protein
MAELSNLAICYEALQRIYRNAVVRFVRAKMVAVYHADCPARLRKPFEREWEKIRASAEERRRTGELSAEILDDFDLLGVNHFFNLFDAYHEVLLPYTDGADKDQRSKEKNALLGWMKTIKNLRDPLSHPSDADIVFEDAFMLLDCARRALARLGLGEESARIRGLTDRLAGRPALVSLEAEPLEDRLPPRELIVLDFVGREAELRALREWFEDPLSRRWALAGEGGKGKSAIAYQFAMEVKLKAPEPFRIVIWLSAKRRRFEEGAVTVIGQPDFGDLDSALTGLLRHFGWTEEIGNTLERKRERVLELLNAFPALVVIDDIDTLEGNAEDAIEFFALIVPQTKSKVLLTSRRTVFGMGGTTTHVGGFTESDAEKFVASRAQLMGLDPATLTRPVTRDVLRVTERSPLYIEDLMRLLLVMPPNEAVRVWAEKSGDEARKYALGRELEMLSADAKLVLLAACVSGGPSSFPELVAVTGLREDGVTNALIELQRLFLVPKPRLIEGEQRFEANVNTRALVNRLFAGSDIFRRVEAAQKAVSGKLPKVGRGDVAAIVRQAVLHVRNRERERAEELLVRGLERYPNDRDLLGVLGWVYRYWEPRRLTDARECFRRSAQLKSGNEEMYCHWGRMEINEGEWTRAAEAAERGLKILTDSQRLLYIAGYSRSRLGKELKAGLHTARGNRELIQAQAHLERAVEVFEGTEPPDHSLKVDIYRALVLNCESAGNMRGMWAFLKQWLAEYPNDDSAQFEDRRLRAKFGEPSLTS